ncbi:hypothetical protein J6E39_05200 [bacterium]|nr:hypothetical protein [bacterium]
MHIMPKIVNYTSSTNDYKTQNQNTVSTPAFGARVNGDVFKRAINKADPLIMQYLSKNSDGEIIAHSTNLVELQEIHKKLADMPELLAQMHLTQNKSGDLPMHYANTEMMHEIHEVLREQPEVLAKIHLTRDKNGDLPMHDRDVIGIREINRVLKDQPEVLAQIYLSKNRSGRYPISNCETRKTLGAICNIALNSDVDVKTSIKLLKAYNENGRFTEAIKELKKQDISFIDKIKNFFSRN